MTGASDEIKVRIDYSEKRAFKEACALSRTTMTHELRKYILHFIKNPPDPSRLYHVEFKRSERRCSEEENRRRSEP